MRVLLGPAALGAACALLAACATTHSHPVITSQSPPAGVVAPVDELTRRAAIDADGRFGADLLATLGAADRNAVLSPYSVAVALQMALEGARGATAAQLAQVLHIPGVSGAELTARAATLRHDLTALDEPRSRVRLRVSNGMWPQAGDPVKPAFARSLRDGFGVAVHPLDFAGDPSGARDTINRAVSEQTEGKIAHLLDSLDPATRLVLTDAVYLKAAWTSSFDAHQTRPGPFHAAGGDVRAAFMHQTGAFGYARRAGYQVVRLPYGRGDLAMTLVVPDGPLTALERTLRRAGLGAVIGGRLDMAPVALALPKFEIRTQVDLTGTLRGLGATDAFGSGADFSGISDEGLAISRVVHEAYVSVGEKGTEAAAASGVMIATSAVAGPREVTVDRPFLFAITDLKTGTPLFLGRVTDPAAH